ncbi:MAG: porin family protein [Chitinophagaceae bacterium]|nr:porin family protein [Chitinophagaceae bacterium]
MFNQNDFFFDNRVRFAAERHTDLSLIPDWNKLEEKLDIEMPIKKKRRRFIVFWLLFTGLLAGSAYWGFDVNFNSKKNYTNVSADTKQNIIIPAESGKNENVNLQDEKVIKDYIDNSPKDTEPKSTIISSLAQTQTIYSNPSPEKRNSKNRTSLTTSRKEQVSVVGENAKAVSNEISNEKISRSDIVFENKSNLATDTMNVLKKTSFPNTDLLKEENIANIVKDTANSITNNPKSNVKKPNVSRFSFTAVSGVNLNSVQLNKPSKLGYEYGLLVGYKFSPKIEIRSGILFSKKFFTTSGKNISFDSAKLNLPSYTSINLEDATGYCRFLEIPVILYYNFPSKNKTSFYTAAGFSINKMRMESVHYKFVADGSTVIERSHSRAYHNSNDFSTSITSNFSIGIKQHINKSWNISFEPYLRLPLTRFNNNNLRFSSFGTMLSVTYSLQGQRKK